MMAGDDVHKVFYEVNSVFGSHYVYIEISKPHLTKMLGTYITASAPYP